MGSSLAISFFPRNCSLLGEKQQRRLKECPVLRRTVGTSNLFLISGFFFFFPLDCFSSVWFSFTLGDWDSRGERRWLLLSRRTTGTKLPWELMAGQEIHPNRCPQLYGLQEAQPLLQHSKIHRTQLEKKKQVFHSV